MKNKGVINIKSISLMLLMWAGAQGAYAADPLAPASTPLPAIDPQARQILATMVNTYQDIEEYADEETIASAGDTTSLSPKDFDRRFTVALSHVYGLFLTATNKSGEKVVVHAFQKDSKQRNPPFVVLTTDSRFPGLYVKDTVTSYEDAQAHSFWSVGLGLTGAGALFSEPGISSLLFNPSFQGLRLGPPGVADGTPYDTVTIELDNGGGTNTLTFHIGQQDHLLRQVTITHVHGAQTTIVTQSLTHIRAHLFTPFPSLFPPSYFQYAPPPGSRLVSAFPSAPAPVHRAGVPPVLPDKAGK